MRQGSWKSTQNSSLPTWWDVSSMDWRGGAGVGHSASACSLFGGDKWHLSEQLEQGHPRELGIGSPPAQTPNPNPDRFCLIPVWPCPNWWSDFAVTDPRRHQGSPPQGEGEVKAALASRILLMNQPPQKAPDIWDFVERGRWEDLERSHPFIELNIPECSPRLSRDETTHQPGERQVQSHAEHAAVHRWMGLGTDSLPAPGGNPTLEPPFPPGLRPQGTMSGGGREMLQGKLE